MSCDRKQRQVAGAAAPAGISRTGSKSAGLAGQSGQSGSVDFKLKKRTLRRRTRRQAGKRYQALSLSEKEKLWIALSKATTPDDEARQDARLKTAVREFGGEVVAAAVIDEIGRFRSDKDDWSLKRYQQLSKKLADIRAQEKTEKKVSQKASEPDKKAQKQVKKGVPEDAEKKGPKKTEKKAELPGPTDRSANGSLQKPSAQVKVTGLFSRQELEQMIVRTLLGGAATNRQMQTLKSGASRGIEFGDPRVKDWVEQDLQNFRFLSRQLSRVSRGEQEGAIDTAGLSEAELVDLWEFSRFEADRTLRNIDHLQSGWSHLKGETADYMTGNYNLEARFYDHLANQLEPRITTEMRDKYGVIEV